MECHWRRRLHSLAIKQQGWNGLIFLAYEWWSEALHGVLDVGHGTHFDGITRSATSFPPVILTTAAFNESLWKTIGVAVSNEARALHNAGLSGLTFWSPTIKVVRDPRPIKAAVCCKHYGAYDVDNWNGIDRYHFDVQVAERDLIETLHYPFEMCVKEGDAASLMCSYNRVNGVLACANPRLLNDTVRGLSYLHGYIVVDCDSVEVMVSGQKYLNDTPVDAVAQSLNAGLDLDCGDYVPKYGGEAIKKGKVAEAKLEEALKNLYIVLMRLGWFDGIPGNYSALGRDDICSPASLELAAEAARQGIVLLQNDNNILPLCPPPRGQKKFTVGVVGPHANATVARIMPAESLDRSDLSFPGFQQDMVEDFADANVLNNVPTIVAIFSVGGIDITTLLNNSKLQQASAIVWACYPGAEGGRTIADVLYGKYNPGN
ncbi:hypothetical protein IFM89_004376 [Coptis chinensis]|uniref:Uncharacterized protein n=1 Tax=Coptis chinensis TaxID=261450 RepID=A0A835IM48_9MAGN|nr:hypothetical protein IFM89_004376 [Coptis chinensis]